MPQVSAVRDSANPSIVTIFNARIAYAQNLNTPTAQQPKPGEKPGEPKYNCVALIPETQTDVLTLIQNMMWEQCQKEFGADATAVWTELQAGNKLALKSGATKASREGFLGNFFLSPSAKAISPPKLFHKYLTPDGSAVQELTRPQSTIYSGCYVNVQVAFWPQNNHHGRRINCELLAVQFSEDGESFGGGASANTSVFAGIAPPQPAGFGAPAAAPGGFAAAPGGFAAPAAAPGGFAAAPGGFAAAAPGGFGTPPGAMQPPAGFAPPGL